MTNPDGAEYNKQAKDLVVQQNAFIDINSRIINDPKSLDDVSDKELADLEAFLQKDKNAATKILFHTLETQKSDTKKDNIRLGDKKILEKVEKIARKYVSMENVGVYQLENKVFNKEDNFATSNLKKYGKLFQTAYGNDWFGHIGDLYLPGGYPKIDALFAKGGEFADAYFTPQQFQAILFKKNTERVNKLISTLKNFDIVSLMTKQKITNVEDLKKGSCNICNDSSVKDSMDGAWEYEYLLKTYPEIFDRWNYTMQDQKDLDTIDKQLTQEIAADALLKDFTSTTVLDNYTKRDYADTSISKFNAGAHSKLRDIISSLTNELQARPTNSKISNLITQLKSGDLVGFQKTVYEGKVSDYTNRNDGKLGKETLTMTTQYITETQASDKSAPDKQKTEVAPVAPAATEIANIKNALATFDVAKINVNLYSGVKGTDYKDVFTAVATTGTDAQITLANTYMTALTTQDQTLAKITTDNMPGIKTFETICTNLGQTDIYTAVKTRLDNAAKEAQRRQAIEATKAAKKAERDAETEQVSGSADYRAKQAQENAERSKWNGFLVNEIDAATIKSLGSLFKQEKTKLYGDLNYNYFKVDNIVCRRMKATGGHAIEAYAKSETGEVTWINPDYNKRTKTDSGITIQTKVLELIYQKLLLQ